ncbi:hypothetical protein [Vibrio sp. F13]|uniref:hypothetical protein n=1 Tax=Vibrio sp. F13 TaxID=2070777 RepID=UPI0010BD363C|nr:hypothetical protein [Vibrio sp. F13]TKG00167.1 hypothetical protein FCV76_15435 [Vibrio sp. F13]
MNQSIKELELWVNNTKEFEEANVKLKFYTNDNNYKKVEDRFYAKALVKDDTLISLSLELENKIFGICKKLSELQLTSEIVELNIAIGNEDLNYLKEFKKLERTIIYTSTHNVDLSQNENLKSVNINYSDNTKFIYPPNLKKLDISFHNSENINENLQNLPKPLNEITVFHRYRSNDSCLVNLDLLNNLNLSTIRIVANIESDTFNFDNHKNLEELLLIPTSSNIKVKVKVNNKIPNRIKKITIHNASIGEIYNHKVSKLDKLSIVNCNFPSEVIQ